MRRASILILGVVAICALVAWSTADKPAPVVTDAGIAVEPLTGATTGYRAHISPGGKFLEEAAVPVSELSKKEQAAFSTSAEGLVEEAGPTGGFSVNLQGRFQNSMVATVDADGELTVPCISGIETETTNTDDSEKE